MGLDTISPSVLIYWYLHNFPQNNEAIVSNLYEWSLHVLLCMRGFSPADQEHAC